MGMLGDGSDYDPSDPDQVGQQYKTPAANLFDQLGILSPSQKQQQAYANQQKMIQMQLNQQQQMLQMRQSQQTLGVDQAKLAEGFGYPTLMAQKAGSTDNPALTQNLNRLVGGMQGGGGLGMVPPPANQIDPSMLIQRAVAGAATPGQGYKLAASQIGALAQATGDTSLAQMSVKLSQMAADQMSKESMSGASIQAKQAEAGKATQETEEAKAKAGNPSGDYKVTFPNGDSGTMVQTHNPDGSLAGFQTIARGKPVQYVSPETPGDRSKDLVDLRSNIQQALGANRNMQSIVQNLKDGAAQGWAGDIVEKMSQGIGTLKQIAPTKDLDEDGMKELTAHTGDFQQWAARTHVNSSLWSDLTMQLASTYAKGGRISNVEIKHATETLGASISNPAIAADVLHDVSGRIDQGLVDKVRTLKIGGTKEFNATADSLLDDYNSHKGTIGPGGSSHPADIQAILSKYPGT